jgi:hypothetical protein
MNFFYFHTFLELGKTQDLPSKIWQTLTKDMPSKKRVHLQQFGIIHLPNSDLTYIRNPERNKIMFIPFHLENLHQESFSILYFFFHPPTYREMPMTTTIRPRIYACGEVSFAKFVFLLSWFAKLLGANFSCFAKIRWMSS